ncbi:MAG: hypothetical protein CVU98_01615 [Firmicutes bacterium HGW-Firmicutes-3]|jgi:putative membrane protein|nr:MAG: hypothetical protein CVU98_01615 [Firmicutes bacterium HGW-Firmicutes-3]
MKKIYKALAIVLSVCILFPTFAQSVNAASPVASTSETLYVNMDYYGKVSNMNIVKGVNLNGNSIFTDYGSYSKVTNMTNSSIPSIKGDNVTWNLSDNTGRFYYEGTPKGRVTLPWNFDVDYKLNGVAADPQKLAGASGMVEINIKATPNPNVNEYYKNNMLLLVGTYVKIDDTTLSVEAPGAQVVLLGSYKLVIFAALPGEANDYTLRIGTNNFETSGIIMTMVPATIAQMDEIKNVRDMKEKSKDSVDSITENANSILNIIGAMSGGLSQLESGLNTVNKSNDAISASRGDLSDKAGQNIVDLSGVAQQTEAMIPHLENTQFMIVKVSENINEITQEMVSAKSGLTSLQKSISIIQDDFEKLSNDGESITTQIDEAQTDMKNYRKSISSLERSLEGLNEVMDGMNRQLQELQQSEGITDPTTAMLAGMMPSLVEVIDASNDTVSASKTLISQSNDYFTEAKAVANNVSQTLDNTQGIADNTRDLLQNGKRLLNDVDSLNDTLTEGTSTANSALQETQELAGGVTNLLNSSGTFLSSFKTTVDENSGSLSQGTRDSISGLIKVMKKSLEAIEQTAAIKKSMNTTKSSLEQEIDNYEENTNILLLDIEAKPVSFTSDKNTSLESVQIIMRTQEISIKNNDVTQEDLDKESGNPFERMTKVFQKIWDAIILAFAQ